MTDLSIISRPDGGGMDTRWRISKDRYGTDRPAQLDLTKFISGTHFNITGSSYGNGIIPSGVAIAKITASGLYGPFDTTLSNGQQTFAGFIDDDMGIPLYIDDNRLTPVSTKAMCARRIAGIIKASVLPVAAQRSTVVAAALTNAVDFTFTEV